MRFLIIDDDDFKIEQFTKYLSKDDTFVVRKSCCTGIAELVENIGKYDCLILDMNFPHFDNERVESDEGLRVLRELKRRKINIPTVIYSSKYVDVSNYSNVKDYIMFSGMCDMKERFCSFKNRLSNF